MGRMVRKQLYIDEAQDLFLQREAERQGITQAQLVRRAIDALQCGAISAPREEAIRRMQELWAEIDRRYDEVAGRGESVEFYEFKRRDAYEERLKHHER